MKTSILTLFLVLACAANVFAEDPIEKKLQQALFAEEGTRDLDKAIAAYNAVIAQYDTQRQFAATAVFRVAECYRKKGQKDQAIASYQRLLTEFPGEETLVRMAGENLAALGAEAGTTDGTKLVTSTSEAAEIARIKKLVALSPDLINDPNTGLLHEAAANSQLEVAEYLLEVGADVNLEAKSHMIKVDRTGNSYSTVYPSPVTVAAKGGHLAMVNFLLSKGAKTDENTILQAGLQNRNVVLEVLLDHLPEGDQGVIDRSLLVACEIARVDFVKALLARGASPTAKSESNVYKSPISVSIEKRDTESVALLIAAGAQPNEDELLEAISKSDEMFDLIWATGVRSPNAFGSAIYSPKKALKIIEGTDEIDLPNTNGTTPLGLACEYILPDMVRAILEKGADPNKGSSYRNDPTELVYTPLIWALRSTSQPKDYESKLNSVVEQLIAAGADLNVKDSDGRTALHHAATSSFRSIDPRTRKAVPSPTPRYAPLSVVEQLLAVSPSAGYSDVGYWTSSIFQLAKVDSPEPALALIADYAWSQLPERDLSVTLASTSGATGQLSAAPMRLSEAIIKRSAYKFGTSFIFNLSDIWVMRPGESKPTSINYSEIIATGDLTLDPVLELGSILFVPLPRPQDYLPSDEQVDYIVRAAAKNVTVVRGEHQWQGVARPIAPDFTQARPLAQPVPAPGHIYFPSSGIVYANTVNELLDAIHAPNEISDLTRIEIRHADGETERFNAVVGINPDLGLALRDGDTITLIPSAPMHESRAVWLSRESDLFLFPLFSESDIAALPEEYGVGYPDLAEFIWAAYSNRGAMLANPDFDNITVMRGDEKITYSWSKIGNAEIPQLLPGDIVNIPKSPEPADEWTRLADNQIQRLQKVLARDVEFQVAGGPKRKVHLGPGFWQFPSKDGHRVAEPFPAPGDEKFDALGLTIPLAIRSLGHSPTDKLDVSYVYRFSAEDGFHGEFGGPTLSDHQIHNVIAEEEFEVLINILPKSEPPRNTRGPISPTRTSSTKMRTRPSTQPTAAEKARAEALQRAKERRVVLPPPAR